MITVEKLSDRLEKRKSDRFVKLLQSGSGYLYDAPIDLIPCPYKYEESNIPVDGEEATSEDYEAALNRLGVET